MNASTDQYQILDRVLADLKPFDPVMWVLMTVTVRVDTGKFVASTWERTFLEGTIWPTIGLHDTVQTIVRKESSGMGYPYVVSGSPFEFVEDVS